MFTFHEGITRQLESLASQNVNITDTCSKNKYWIIEYSKQSNLEKNAWQHVSFKSYLFTYSLLFSRTHGILVITNDHVTIFTFLAGQWFFKAVSSIMQNCIRYTCLYTVHFVQIYWT